MAERILTTHVGSLPRPQDVVDLVFAEDHGEPVDRAAFERVVGAAVADRVRRQAEAGVDLVSDGEMSKIGYATYIRHRLSGFEVGEVPRATPADLDAYPVFRDRLASPARRPATSGRSVAAPSPTSTASRSNATSRGSPPRSTGAAVTGGFMNAPSPGIIALFQPNEYYPSFEAYLGAHRRRDAGGVRGHRRGRLPAADRRAGPRHGPPHHVPGPSPTRSSWRARRLQIEALNHALSGIDPADRVRLHLCWGNYEGPHHLDIGVEKIIGAHPLGPARHARLRGVQPAPRARVGRLGEAPIPDDKVLAPGRDRHDHQLHRAPRAGGRADPSLRRHRRRRAGDRRHRLRLRHLGRLRGHRPRHLLGQAALARRGRAPGFVPAPNPPAARSGGRAASSARRSACRGPR